MAHDTTLAALTPPALVALSSFGCMSDSLSPRYRRIDDGFATRWWRNARAFVRNHVHIIVYFGRSDEIHCQNLWPSTRNRVMHRCLSIVISIV